MFTNAAMAKVGYGLNWGGWTAFSNHVDFTNNNSLNNNSGSILAFSQNNGANTKYVKRQNAQYSAIQNLSNSGLFPLVSNGSDFSQMKPLVFNNSTSSPYLLTECTNNFSSSQLEKENEITSLPIGYGRTGALVKDSLEFIFNIGDVLVDNNIIKFVERIDTLPVYSIEELNEVVRTNNFYLTPQSELIFSNLYYVLNSSSASSVLSDQFYLNYKCQLINAVTNQVVGTFDPITYTASNTFLHNNAGYLINCEGISEGNYYLKLTFESNETFKLFVGDVQRDDVVLEKSNLHIRNFKGEGIPTVYDLEQNFPNPFNPNTTIRYQLPEDGLVTLKIYDVLGAEVVMLVNEEKAAGKYEVNFNASSLASGVYIYKVQAGSFINSKKMILLK